MNFREVEMMVRRGGIMELHKVELQVYRVGLKNYRYAIYPQVLCLCDKDAVVKGIFTIFDCPVILYIIFG